MFGTGNHTFLSTSLAFLRGPRWESIAESPGAGGSQSFGLLGMKPQAENSGTAYSISIAC